MILNHQPALSKGKWTPADECANIKEWSAYQSAAVNIHLETAVKVDLGSDSMKKILEPEVKKRIYENHYVNKVLSKGSTAGTPMMIRVNCLIEPDERVRDKHWLSMTKDGGVLDPDSSWRQDPMVLRIRDSIADGEGLNSTPNIYVNTTIESTQSQATNLSSWYEEQQRVRQKVEADQCKEGPGNLRFAVIGGNHKRLACMLKLEETLHERDKKLTDYYWLAAHVFNDLTLADQKPLGELHNDINEQHGQGSSDYYTIKKCRVAWLQHCLEIDQLAGGVPIRSMVHYKEFIGTHAAYNDGVMKTALAQIALLWGKT
jgi:hypothetical protein